MVLGTSFNVNSNDRKTEINVTTGKVKVQSISDQKVAILEVGEAARVFNGITVFELSELTSTPPTVILLVL